MRKSNGPRLTFPLLNQLMYPQKRSPCLRPLDWFLVSSGWLLGFSILASFKSYQNWYRLVTMRTRGDFIVPPYLEVRPPAP